jgi:putative selenate reductase molybdopterin-binding subunit
MMQINLNINDEDRALQIAPGDTLLHLLRREGYFGVKHGCEDGSCGACTVLVNGAPRASCTMLAAQAAGARISTIESVAGVSHQGFGPSQGWRGQIDLHPLQQAFVETGAIQCGYCTPAMILAAKALLDDEPNPTERRAVPLHRLRQAGAGCIARSSHAAR